MFVVVGVGTERDRVNETTVLVVDGKHPPGHPS
jgi:hypothetical protein